MATAAVPATVAAPTAGRLLGEVTGGGEMLGALDGAALLVVSLDASAEAVLPLPPSLPCVVVGISRDPAVRPAPAGVDIALMPGEPGEGPAGWVAVEDVDAELARLAGRVGQSPQVAVVLAHVLRTSEHLDIGRGLLVESLAYSSLQGGPSFASWLDARRAKPRRARPETERAVLVDRTPTGVVVTLNRPHVRNAVSARLRDQLCEALAVACADPSIQSVELRGAGPAFSSGGDLDEFGSLPDPVTAHLVRTSRSPARLIAAVASRTTAFVHGACVGAGIELAAFTHRVVAAADTRLQLPEIGLGLIPGAGGTVSIPRRVGRQRAAWLGLSAATIDVTTARRWGLVDEIGPAGPAPGDG